MTRLYALLILVFMLMTGGCAHGADSEPVAKRPRAVARDVSRPHFLAIGAFAPAIPTPTTQTTEPAVTCPVTQPSDPPFTPSGSPVEPFGDRFWYGSDDLFLALPLDATWSQLAQGDKVFWWSRKYPGGAEESEPAITIRARHLDPPGEIFEQHGATNASHPTFPATAMLHGLSVPAPGCWEITGEYKGEVLSFIVWV